MERINERKGRLRRVIYEKRIVLAAFFLPSVIMAAAFAAAGVYPFGGQQIPVIDMYHQYIPFLEELQYKLQEGGSLFYTWNGAGGSNFWTLLAYYGASPLNLLLVLFPKGYIVEGATVILLIKVGLAGSFMSMYLRYEMMPGHMCAAKGGRYADFTVLGFSTLYALCSYVMAYYWCIMWMDAVALLPLCMLGLVKLIDEGRTALYTVSLALIVFTNYYMAIMVCIFILFYYPVLYFLRVRAGGAKRCLGTLATAVGHSFLGILMAGIMLLPTYLSMQNTYYISADMPEDTVFYNDALDILNQLLPNAELTYRDGLPNIYCGMIVVMMLVFYMLSRTISLREKALNIAFLVFLFLSLNINKLDFLWHGLHFPNQLPYRYTFVICFVLICMAVRMFVRIDEVRIRHIWAVLACGIGYYIMAQKLLADDIDYPDLFFYGGIAWLAIYCVVFAAYRKGTLRSNMFVILIFVLVACEALSSAFSAVDRVGTTTRDGYFANNEDISRLVDSVDDDFARVEMNDNYVLNCPALYHYKGVSQFSSSINANTTAFMEKIGVEGDPAKNRFNYNQTDPVTNAILGVKYLIGKNLPIEDSDFKLIRTSGNSRLYENLYPLSIGYRTGSEIRTWDTGSDDPFAVLDDYVRAVTAGRYDSIFTDTECVSVAASNMDIEEEGNGIWETAIHDTKKKSRVVLTYTAAETAKQYVFIEADGADTIKVSDGDVVDDVAIRNDCGSIVNIGEMEQGQSFTITIDYAKGRGGRIVSRVCTMDEAVWQDTYAVLSENMMEVQEYGDTYIKGTIDADEDGVLVISVPYEKGWKLEIDGEERSIDELVGDCLISTAIDAGKHEVELSFRPPGLVAGAAVTVLSCAVLILLCRRRSVGRPPRGDEVADGAGDRIDGDAGIVK